MLDTRPSVTKKRYYHSFFFIGRPASDSAVLMDVLFLLGFGREIDFGGFSVSFHFLRFFFPLPIG